MPMTRRARRAATRTNTKRTILSALNEDEPISDDFNNTNTIGTDDLKSNTMNSQLPDLDIFKVECIEAILQDIKKQVKTKQESISITGAEINKHQQEVYFINTMKLEKSVKKMTIREFNQKHMSAGENIIDIMKQIMEAQPPKAGAKKRVRPQYQNQPQQQQQYMGSGLPLETPVRQIRPGIASRTPGTILRTARKNEAIYSANGSPINQTEEGDLIATVSKKRRGNSSGASSEYVGDGTMFGISVGDGRTISLSDPDTMDHLTNEMKNTAKNQLNVLQDQLSKLLSKLG